MANDPYFNSREMDTATTQAESIYNEFVARVHASFGRITSRILATPPGSPNAFDSYIVPPGATDAWAGLDGNIVVWLDAWLVVPIKTGMRCHIIDQETTVEFTADGGTVGTATSGTQEHTLVEVSGSWRIQDWDLLKGSIVNVALTQNAILFAPTNAAPGRSYVLRVQQDGTGGRTLTCSTGEFATVGGVAAVDIATGANEVTDIVIQGPSPNLTRPVIYATYKNLVANV